MSGFSRTTWGLCRSLLAGTRTRSRRFMASPAAREMLNNAQGTGSTCWAIARARRGTEHSHWTGTRRLPLDQPVAGLQDAYCRIIAASSSSKPIFCTPQSRAAIPALLPGARLDPRSHSATSVAGAPLLLPRPGRLPNQTHRSALTTRPVVHARAAPIL